MRKLTRFDVYEKNGEIIKDIIFVRATKHTSKDVELAYQIVDDIRRIVMLQKRVEENFEIINKDKAEKEPPGQNDLTF